MNYKFDKIPKMPTLVNNSELLQAISENGFIQNGKPENIDGIKYDFSLSQRVLKAKFKQPINVNDLPQTTRTEFVVEPGEVVFVLTEEKLKMPDNIMAILIPKRKLSHDGIMVLGGLSVDPLYSGRLLMGLYNLSSSAFPIISGKKLIAAQFYKLSDDEKHNINAPHAAILDFPDELIKLMQNYKPVSTEALMNSVNLLESKFEDLLSEIKSKDDWFERFQSSQKEQSKTIDEILAALQKEVNERKDSERSLEKQIQSTFEKSNETIQKYSRDAYKLAAVTAAVLSIVIPALYWFFTHFLITQK